MTFLYLAEVAIFALAFQLDGRHLEGEEAMGLPSSVVFSLHNLFSASFQSARVTSIYTLALAALQRIAGLLTNAMVTGLFFLRFTKVDAPLRFSSKPLPQFLARWPSQLSVRDRGSHLLTAGVLFDGVVPG